MDNISHAASLLRERTLQVVKRVNELFLFDDDKKSSIHSCISRAIWFRFIEVEPI